MEQSAYSKGYAAGYDYGYGKHSNPYTQGTKEYREWKNGFNNGQWDHNETCQEDN